MGTHSLSRYYRRAWFPFAGFLWHITYSRNQNWFGFFKCAKTCGSLLKKIIQHLCHWFKIAMITSALFKTKWEKNIRFS